MAKTKGKKGGKGKKGKGKIEKPEGALTEVDKTFYELTITDLNRKLARLRSTNTELEEKNEILNEKLMKLDEDKNDVIVYLKRILQEKTDEISELQTGITKLQESLKQDKEECTAKTEQMENDYKQMHEQLTSEIKLLEGKLNALEEFRLQREDLMKKFETQEEQIEEQEQKHKRAIYETERKFIIAKDKLKKDMEARLLQLSTEFQDATEIRIAATTHRVIRENIAINNELDDMLNVHKRLYSENQSMKQKDKTLKQQAQLHCEEKNKALSKVRVQSKIIEKLSCEHETIKKNLEKFKNIEYSMHEAKAEARKVQLEVESLKNNIRVLEQNLHASKCTITSLKTNCSYYKAESNHLEGVLLEAVAAIKDATSILKTHKITNKAILANKRETLINQLFKMLISARDLKIKKPSISSVSSMESIYKRGDLGFIPTEIKEMRPMLKALRNFHSQTGSSLAEESDDEVNKSQSRLAADVEDDKVYVEETNEEEEEGSQPSVLFFDEKESSDEESLLREEVDSEEDGNALSATQVNSASET